jgi:outer membrane protein assembly factor BamB
VVTVAVLVLLAGVAAIAYRVFAPAELVTPASTGYPPPVSPTAGTIARLAAAPLIVDRRLRVSAAERQVRAEAPVNAHNQVNPFWSYRRWPQWLDGLVATGTTVISRWSDGKLIALDARTGRVAWRADGPRPVDSGYAGRRTGAVSVYAPRGLFTATASGGAGVVVAADARDAAGYDPATGRQLWHTAIADRAGCLGDAFTGGGLFAVFDRCADPPALDGYDVATGVPLSEWRPPGAARWGLMPIGCALGGSGCRGVRTLEEGRTRGWLLRGAGLVAAPILDDPNGWLVDDMVLTPDGGQSGADATTWIARRLADERQTWRWDSTGGAARVLAVEPGAIHLLTSARDLVTVDTASGRELSRFRCSFRRDGTDWAPGRAYAADRFVVIERLRYAADPDDRDDAYYRFPEPVLLAGT